MTRRSLESEYRNAAATGLVRRLLELARDEDLGPDGLDVTTEVAVTPGELAEARLVAREAGTIAGLAFVPELIGVFGGGVQFEPKAADGDAVGAGAVLGLLRGDYAAVLRIERTLLNLVGRLSGVATRTSRFVAAVPPGSPARIFDTRKTTPGLRVLEKYAVRCGGGESHRLGLHDALLLKDNHLAGLSGERLAARVVSAASRARQLAAGRRRDLLFVEVEVDSLEQLRAVLAAPPGLVDVILLDNMDIEQLRGAVALRDAAGTRPLLEASGGVTLDRIPDIARTGVERISAGSITHHATWLDVALDILPGGGA